MILVAPQTFFGAPTTCLAPGRHFPLVVTTTFRRGHLQPIKADSRPVPRRTALALWLFVRCPAPPGLEGVHSPGHFCTVPSLPGACSSSPLPRRRRGPSLTIISVVSRATEATAVLHCSMSDFTRGMRCGRVSLWGPRTNSLTSGPKHGIVRTSKFQMRCFLGRLHDDQMGNRVCPSPVGVTVAN